MQEPTLTVAELSAQVARVVASAFPDELWVRGEIRNLNRSPSGHVYFSLVDPESRADMVATLPVTLFSSDRVAVNRVLVRTGALRMTDGVEVRIRGRLGHYAARGTVQLRMTWIDTEYTVGRLAADRDRLIRTLRAEGLLRRNAALPVATVPLRVGLVTSAGSAAEADFLEVLAASGFAFSVIAVDSRVQGPDAASSLRAGIKTLEARNVDVIAVIRGGGAATDLAAFDDEGLARAIAVAAAPVFTGIGHEVDTTVADEVAARSFTTPTACAAALADAVAGFVTRVDTLARGVSAAADVRLARTRSSLDSRAGRLVTVATATTRIERRLAARRSAQLREQSQRAGRRAARAISDAEARVRAHDPRRLLARGWSITRDQSGALVKSYREIGDGTAMSTTVADGTIRSVVTGVDGA